MAQAGMSTESAVLNALNKGPSTARQVAEITGINIYTVRNTIQRLKVKGKVDPTAHGSGLYVLRNWTPQVKRYGFWGI